MKLWERALVGGKQVSFLPGPEDIGPLECLRRMLQNPLTELEALHRQYGDIVRIPMPVRNFVLLTDPELSGKILVGTEKNNTKSLGYRRLQVVLGQGLVTSDGDLWKQQRKLANPSFTAARLQSFVQPILNEADQLVDELHQQVRKDPIVDISKRMMHTTFSIIMRILFSYDAHAKTEIVRRSMSIIQEFANYLFYSAYPLPLWVPTAQHRLVRKALADLDAIVYEMIAEHEAKPELYDDLLSAYLQAFDPEAQYRMTKKLLRDELVTLMLAGHETTAHALSMSLQFLAENPEIAERAHHESRQTVEQYQDLSALSYHHQIFQEAMRLHPPVWAVGRELTQATHLGGHDYPKGTTFLMAQYLIHRHPKYWTQPTKFNPDRFAPEKLKVQHRFAFLPFGAGARTCIGAALAKMEGQLILSRILRDFKLQVIDNYQYRVHPRISLVLDPGIRLRLIPR